MRGRRVSLLDVFLCRGHLSSLCEVSRSLTEALGACKMYPRMRSVLFGFLHLVMEKFKHLHKYRG